MQEFDPVSYILGQNSTGPYKQSGIVAYLMGKAEANIVERTASGAVAHITDAIAAPFKGVTAQITPVQSGYGDPSPDNVRPISGWSAVNIYHAGVNYPKTAWQRSMALNGSTGEVTEQTIKEYYASPLIPLTASKKLYIDIQMGASGYRYLTVCTYDSNGDFIEKLYSATKASDAHVVTEYTAGSTAAFIRMSCGIGTGTINYCTTDLSTVTITFPNDPGTVYGGTLSIAEDGSVTLTVTQKMYDMGNLDWNSSGASATQGTFWMYGDTRAPANTWRKPGNNNTLPRFMCSQYTPVTGNAREPESTNRVDHSIFWEYNGNYICIRNSDYTGKTAAEVKTALAGVQLLVDLRQPVTYTLTPITPLTALAGENNLWADSGDISVTYLADGRASNQLAVSMLLGRSYQHDPSDPDDATAAEALSILTGGDTR